MISTQCVHWAPVEDQMDNSISAIRRDAYRMKDLDKNHGGRTPFSQSYIYSEIKNGDFPAGKLVAPNVRVWTETQIEAEMQRRFKLYNQKPERCDAEDGDEDEEEDAAA
jgi:predicted DNA-binding transcriptional regulator AlpA